MQVRDQCIDTFQHMPDRKASGALQVSRYRFGDAFLAGLAKAVQFTDAPVRGGLQQLPGRVRAEFVVEGTNALGPQSRHLEQVGETGGDFAVQTLEERAGTGIQHVVDLGRKVLADPRQFGEAASGLGPGGHLFGPAFQRTRGTTVGTDAERIRFFELEQIGDLVESDGQIGIGHRHGSAPVRLATPAAHGVMLSSIPA